MFNLFVLLIETFISIIKFAILLIQMHRNHAHVLLRALGQIILIPTTDAKLENMRLLRSSWDMEQC